MIDYETYCRIHDHLQRQHLTFAQTARALGLHPQTVAKWAAIKQFRPRLSTARTSLLDPFKAQIVRWLESHPYSAQQIFQRLREAGSPAVRPSSRTTYGASGRGRAKPI